MTLRVFIVLKTNDSDWHAANTGVLSDLLSERRASKAGKEKSYGPSPEMHGAIVIEDDSLLSLQWPGASSHNISLHFSTKIAEDVIAGSAGPGSSSNMGRSKN